MESDSNCYILTNQSTRLKVSSTLPGNSGEYSKQNMLDNNPQTSWYSNQGKFQYICLFFDDIISINEIIITFSGGFCPKEIELYSSDEDQYECKKLNLNKITSFQINDDDNQKILKLPQKIDKCKTIKLLMKSFYDLYGRVIVYDLKVKGYKL